MKKIKIGNTIKTALSIYLNRFKTYYLIAFTNSFWIFVPVFGWAKYEAMMGLLARLAHDDLTNKNETIVEAERYIKPKKWLFFGAGLMSSISFYLRIFVVGILFWIVAAIAVKANPSLSVNTLFLLTISIPFAYYFYWRMSHLLLYEFPLAVSENTNASQSRNIGWELVMDSIFPLQVIIFAFSLIYVFPYFLLEILARTIGSEVTLQSSGSIMTLLSFSYVTFFKPALFFLGVVFIPVLPSALYILLSFALGSILNWWSNSILILLFIIIFTIFNIAVGALFIPFWQSLKAVAYYRLNLDLENTN